MSSPASYHRLIQVSDPDGWHQALAGLPHSFHHSWEQARVAAAASGLPVVLYSFNNGTARAVCPLLLRHHAGETDVVSPPGFSGFASHGQCGDFRRQWFDFAQAQGWVCAYLAQHPLPELSGLGLEPDSDPGPEVFILDLTPDDDRRLAALSRCRRRQIKDWHKDPDWLCTDRHEVAAFLATEADPFFDHIGFTGLRPPPASWVFLAEAANVLVLGARRNGKLVAANLFGWAGTIADAPFNISTHDGRDAATALMWAGAGLLKARGVKQLNMGGGARPGDGIETAKRRFNCRAVRVQRLRQVFRPEVFARLCAAAGMQDSGYFPPYHAPSKASQES